MRSVLIHALTILALSSSGLFSRLVEAETQEMSPAEFGRSFVVRVINRTADFFTAEAGSGHGTGYLVEMRKNTDGSRVGVIFTNLHVVDVPDQDAQTVLLEFSTDTEVPETVNAKVVYTSQVHDFAVLEFEMSGLKRAKRFLRAGKMPAKEDPRYDFVKNFRHLQGRNVMALGNPFDGSNITTFGQITGLHRDEISGPHIQTQTPINPGNSGGPLVDLEDLTVVGMNTAKVVDADNIGFSIPIGVLLDEYRAWRGNPQLAHKKTIMVHLGLIPSQQVIALGLADSFKKIVPKYFERFDGALWVHDAHPSSQLKTGDMIVKLGNQVPGRSIYNYELALQSSDQTIPMTIIRDGKTMVVQAKVINDHRRKLRRQVDFVYASGLIFRHTTNFKQWAMDPSLSSSVILSQIVDSPETNFGAFRFPPPGSMVLRVTIGGQSAEVHNLAELKAALRRHKDQKMARIDVREPVYFPSEGQMIAVPSKLGTLTFNPTTTSYWIPISEVVTPKELSLNKFRRQFSFTQEKTETRDWRLHLERVKGDPKAAPYCINMLSETSPTHGATKRRSIRPAKNKIEKN